VLELIFVSDNLKKKVSLILHNGKSYLAKELFRNIFILLGLSGFGIIVYEILIKWEFLGRNYSFLWVIVPILILFVCKSFINSTYIRNHPKFSPTMTKRIVSTINIVLTVVTILIIISIPFLWYGVIKELAGK
jgi:hypothetical protein